MMTILRAGTVARVPVNKINPGLLLIYEDDPVRYNGNIIKTYDQKLFFIAFWRAYYFIGTQ